MICDNGHLEELELRLIQFRNRWSISKRALSSHNGYPASSFFIRIWNSLCAIMVLRISMYDNLWTILQQKKTIWSLKKRQILKNFRRNLFFNSLSNFFFLSWFYIRGRVNSLYNSALSTVLHFYYQSRDQQRFSKNIKC